MREVKAKEKSFLVEVTPIAKNTLVGTLSYFSSIQIARGTFVLIPVKRRVVTAVVLSSRNARDAKTEIRQANFQLKKISKRDILKAELELEFLTAAEKTATYYATSVGAILTTIIPKTFLDKPEFFFKPIGKRKKKAKLDSHKDTLLLQMETEERFTQYRALVRQSFARGTSIMFLVPTHADLRRAQIELSKGIKEFVHVFSLSDKVENLQTSWQSATTEPHPILFITTPAGLSFFRKDLETIIVERENSRAYHTLAKPYINFKKFVEYYAKLKAGDLVLGDSIFSLETLWRDKLGEYGENSLMRWRLLGAPSKLIDIKTSQNKKGYFEIFSDELKEFLEKALAERERVFLFGARKGLAPSTVCGDCGTVLECENCKSPVVLHQRGELRIYICHACGNRRESKTLCGHCKSWKLVPLGIGTEEIARALKELFPKVNIYILDKDHASTDKRARNIVKKFEESGGILVGTELAFFYLEQVAYSGLVSLDALFSIPDFGINERVFYLVSHLREITQKESIIQTRNIGRQVLAWATLGNIIDFYFAEIEERKTLLYPPFSIFIKITGPKDSKLVIQDLGIKHFAKWSPDILKNSIILRIPREKWPDKELGEKLSLLSAAFSIKVDPESII